MFDATSQWYEAIYRAAGKDYATEAATVCELIRRHAPAARSVLDVACGPGGHLAELTRSFDRLAGLDRNADFVRIAAQRCPRARIECADMRDFDLGERFDVVLCLFSSIGYVRDQTGLRAAVAAMAAHLSPGGLLVIEPSFDPATWQPGYQSLVTVDQPELKIARISHSGRRGDVAQLDFSYLIGTPQGVRHQQERHELGLFRRDDYARACRRAGLVAWPAERDLTGRGLVLAAADRSA